MAETISSRELPEILPVFPLTGTLLLPGTTLPLHIFEPRYCNMVEDALGGDKVFGMISGSSLEDIVSATALFPDRTRGLWAFI